ncbi:MAG: c-type cytochrome biogenesis protein CcmI, partial [Proteobacteria bacterium]|nr:c-type cytochrome biogenesis protein CcmI [Pseudomonadota bacterium]
MNIMFWVLMILMLLLAIGLLVFPLLKVRSKSSLAYKDSNLTINEEKIKELNLDLDEGRIDQEFYNAARDELDRELLIDIPVETKETSELFYTATAERHPAIAILIALFVPMLALLLYLDLGMHSASDEVQNVHQPQAAQEPSMEDMIAQLEQRIEAQGGSAEEWAMLGRAHKYKGDNEQAAKAFAVALENDTDNVQLMLERAEVLALVNNRTFNGEARELVMKAYALDSDNPNVLWFAGVAEFQAGEFRNAIAHLTKLLPMAGGEEDVMKSIIGIVAQSRQGLIDAGENVPTIEALLGVQARPAE